MTDGTPLRQDANQAGMGARRARPWHQVVVLVVGWTLAGVIALGTLLDALSNAAALFTRERAAAGSFAIFVSWSAVELLLHFRGISWRYGSSTPTRIRSLGLRTRCFAVGVMALLWMPTMFWAGPSQPQVANIASSTAPVTLPAHPSVDEPFADCKPVQSCSYTPTLDARSDAYLCVEWGQDLSRDSAKARCKYGFYRPTPCAREDTVGGCLDTSKDECATRWYFAVSHPPMHTTDDVRDMCKGPNQAFVAPTVEVHLDVSSAQPITPKEIDAKIRAMGDYAEKLETKEKREEGINVVVTYAISQARFELARKYIMELSSAGAREAAYKHLDEMQGQYRR